MSFSDADAGTAWNEGAQAWHSFVESGADYYRHEVHGPALLKACEPLDGLRVLDLGCGQGFFSRQLAKRGAHVVAVDLSDELLGLARAREVQEQLGIEYRKVNAANAADQWPTDSFQVVTACMSVHDMANIPNVLKGACAVLRPGGRMVFSVPHPATDMAFREWERDAAGRKVCLKVDRYFDTGPTITRWDMPRLRYHWSTPCWRYTLSEWATLIMGAGFTIVGLHEPRPTAEQVSKNPNLDDCRRVPFFLIFEVRKPISQSGAHQSAAPRKPSRLPIRRKAR